jgi:hypothetical protein
MTGNGLGSNPGGPPDAPLSAPDSSAPGSLDGSPGRLDGPPAPLDGPPAPLDGPPLPLDVPVGPPDALPPGYDQWAAVCGKHYGDAVSAAMCAGNQPPSITSIAELEQRLDMNRNNSTLSFTGLSTGLGLHMVTPIGSRIRAE